jgi:hypothetical protein
MIMIQIYKIIVKTIKYQRYLKIMKPKHNTDITEYITDSKELRVLIKMKGLIRLDIIITQVSILYYNNII